MMGAVSDRESPHDGDESDHSTTGYPVAPVDHVERVARAIAAGKRKMPSDHPEIDRIWTSYVGQARRAMNETRAIYNEYGYGLPKVCAIERRTGRTLADKIAANRLAASVGKGKATPALVECVRLALEHNDAPIAGE